MKNILISACLLGVCCRYDGQSKKYDGIEALIGKYNLIPFCPEIYGGLPTPRIPAERQGERVINAEGADVSENYERGALEALKLSRKLGCEIAVMKERSPSCAPHEIYDGTFTKTLVSGLGVCAEILSKNGVKIISENELDKLFFDKL